MHLSKGTDTVITDYLIIGAGAMGVAFADELFSLNPNTHITIVERRENLGGHWNDAYDFVKLHQPSAFYGVNSLKLGKGNEDLSSKKEILAYYKNVYQKLNNSGQVDFLFSHNYIGNQQVALINQPDKIIQYKVKLKVVDARYMNVEIPSTHPPKFAISEGVSLVPLNELIHHHYKWEQFYIIGNGKTGIDAVLYLLAQGINPNCIFWIAPNDAWFFNRSHMQAGKVTKEVLIHGTLIKGAKEVGDIFIEAEKKGGILRLDKNIVPTKWRCATVNLDELKKLQSIRNIIRKGRVLQITPTEVQLQEGNISYTKQTLFVNCTADGLAKREAKPIFSEGMITLQSVLFCQQVFSASLIAKLEALNLSDKKRNRIKPVPHPELKEDWPWIYYNTIRNLIVFNFISPIWLFKARLNFLSHEKPINYLYYSLKAIILFIPIKRAAKRMKT